MTAGSRVRVHGRAAIVLAAPPPERLLPQALIRFVDEPRERVLVAPYELEEDDPQ